MDQQIANQLQNIVIDLGSVVYDLKSIYPSQRERIATAVLQGLCSWDHNNGKMMYQRTDAVQEALDIADRLIARLKP